MYIIRIIANDREFFLRLFCSSNVTIPLIKVNKNNATKFSSIPLKEEVQKYVDDFLNHYGEYFSIKNWDIISI